MSGRSLRVAVLMGGLSSEREVSLVSGEECAKAATSLGHDVVKIDVGRDLALQLEKIKPDVALNALHGRFGEDGIVQGILELMNIPYTHSGVLASSLAMDKEKTKLVYRAAGLPVAASILARKSDIMAAHVMPTPYVVKPYNDGSSVGVYIVQKGENPPKIAADMPDILMVEQYLPGRELTTTVMGDRALGVTDIRAADGGWYDYSAKYTAGGSVHECPANIPAEITELCNDYALRAHQALGCRGISRTDFRWEEALGADGLFLLETNTQPGMTPTSLAPEQAAYNDVDFNALIAWMIEDASCSR